MTKKTPEKSVVMAEMPPGQWAVVTAPQFLAVLSGAYMAGFDRDGRITLRYTDDTREKAVLAVEDSQRLYDEVMGDSPNAGWMALVGEVQKVSRAERKED